MLDVQEYLALAVDASQKADHHAALNYLNNVLAQEPENAFAIYLKGAEHAELGLFERSIEEIEQAITIKPDIEIAYLQLALLYMQFSHKTKATETLNKLTSFTKTEDFKLFANGLIALIDEDHKLAQQYFESGLALTPTLPEFNQVVINIMNTISGNVQAQDKVSSVEDEDKPIFLGAYQQNDE